MYTYVHVYTLHTYICTYMAKVVLYNTELYVVCMHAGINPPKVRMCGLKDCFNRLGNKVCV